MESRLIVRGIINMNDDVLKIIIVIGLILILSGIGEKKNGK